MSPTRDLSRAGAIAAAAQREIARRWFFAGFAASGQGFNGETVNPSRHGGATRALNAEFERRYAQRED